MATAARVEVAGSTVNPMLAALVLAERMPAPPALAVEALTTVLQARGMPLSAGDAAELVNVVLGAVRYAEWLARKK